MPVLLQSMPSVLDLLEEINNQASKGRQEMLSQASTFVQTSKEAASLLIKIQTSADAMANAPVRPVVIKLLQKKDAVILGEGISSPKITTLIKK